MPNNDYYWTGLAGTCSNLSEHDEGLIAANRAVEVNPNSANAYNTRGAIFRDLGDYKAATADCTSKNQASVNAAAAATAASDAYASWQSTTAPAKTITKSDT